MKQSFNTYKLVYVPTAGACSKCGTTEIPHKAHGVCRRCYMRTYMKHVQRPKEKRLSKVKKRA